MNYSECLIELIKTYPIKDLSFKTPLDEVKAVKEKDEIIARFDTEILTMANIAVHSVELNTDYMLVVGSRYGTMLVLDNSELLEPVMSYYLKTGIMYGPSSKKKRQFSFEIVALANKKGVSFSNDLGVRESKGETGLVFSAIDGVLHEYFSK